LQGARYQNLEVNGNLRFSQLVVDDALEVNGNTRGKDLACKTLDSNGSLELEDAVLVDLDAAGAVKVKGLKVSANAEIAGSAEIEGASIIALP
jgi:hypothetical protein